MYCIAMALLAVAMFFCGCTSGPKQIGPRRATEWAYAPNSIAVHPLSRIRIDEDNEASVIAHIVMLDGDGFACRGVGTLTIRITNTQGELVDEKTVDLSSQEVNRSCFDAVTRTYRLPVSAIKPNTKEVRLRATFTSSGERTLKSKSATLVNHESD